jgi:hypothetical protein
MSKSPVKTNIKNEKYDGNECEDLEILEKEIDNVLRCNTANRVGRQT